jgi:hypothetical protein
VIVGSGAVLLMGRTHLGCRPSHRCIVHGCHVSLHDFALPNVTI